MQSQLTGTYHLNPSNSDNPSDIAGRAAQNLPSDIQQAELDRLISRLQAPDVLVIDRHGNSLTIGSSMAPQLTLVKTASTPSFVVGVAASYTLQVTNTGTAATTGRSGVAAACFSGG